MRKLRLREIDLPKVATPYAPAPVGETEWCWNPPPTTTTKMSDSKAWYETITVQTLGH